MKLRTLGLAVACAVIAAGLAACGGKSGSPAAASASAKASAAAPAPAKNAAFKIGVIQVVEHQALDAANKGIIDGLAARGYKDGEKIRVDQQNAQADQSNMKNIAQRFVSNKSDLIFAIATPAAQTVANTTKT